MPSSVSVESGTFWTLPRTNVAGWLAHYEGSAVAPWRDVLMTGLKPFAPFASILDVGCHCGPNLRCLRASFPWCPYAGLDVSVDALVHGQQVAERDGYGVDTTWVYGSILDQLGWPDRAFDLVLASSVLSVIGPDDLPVALETMVRLSDRLIVVQEPDDERHSGIFHQWGHNYMAGFLSTPGAEAFDWTTDGGLVIGMRR